MKKIFFGVLVFAFVLTLSACGQKTQNNEQEKVGEQQQNKVEETKNSGEGVISSIKEAMGLGKKMECVYTTKIGDKEIKATTWVDGKNFKSTSEIDGRAMYSVLKDEVMYTWGEGMPVASKLALSCMKDLEKSMPKTEGQKTETPIKDPSEAFNDATNVVCKPVASVDISVPSDIQFQDMCEMMKGMANSLKDIKIPAGANPPANIPNVPGKQELE